MNRTIFSLLVLLLFGLFSQPSIAQSARQKNQQNAENRVARMSEAEMRTELQAAKARQRDLQNVLRTGNYTEFYGQGDDDISKGVSKAFAPAEYDYVTAIINAIEKRLGEIEEKRRQEEEKKKKEQEELEKKKKEQEELERKKKEQEELEKKKKEQEELEKKKKEQEELERQRQEELERQRQEELEKQRQKEFQESVERNLEELQPIYNQRHKDVDANKDAASNGNMALDRAIGEIDPNSVPITDAMLAEQQSTTSNTKLGDISSKFNNKPKETKEELEETKEEESEDDKRRRELIEKVQNHLNSLEK